MILLALVLTGMKVEAMVAICDSLRYENLLEDWIRLLLPILPDVGYSGSHGVRLARRVRDHIRS